MYPWSPGPRGVRNGVVGSPPARRPSEGLSFRAMTQSDTPARDPRAVVDTRSRHNRTRTWWSLVNPLLIPRSWQAYRLRYSRRAEHLLRAQCAHLPETAHLRRPNVGQGQHGRSPRASSLSTRAPDVTSAANIKFQFFCCYDTYPTGQGATLRRHPTTPHRTTHNTTTRGHRCPPESLHAPGWVTGATPPTRGAHGQVTVHGDATHILIH